MVATNHVRLFRFKLNLKVSTSVALAIFHVLNSHMWPVITIMDSAASEHLHYYRKFYCAALIQAVDLGYSSGYLFLTFIIQWAQPSQLSVTRASKYRGIRNEPQTKKSPCYASNLATFLTSMGVSIFFYKMKVTGPGWRTFLLYPQTKPYAESLCSKQIKSQRLWLKWGYCP